MYSFRETTVSRDEIVLRPGDHVDEIIIVKSGCLQILIRIDGIDFILSKMEAGSILNSQSIFQLYQNMFCSVRCGH